MRHLAVGAILSLAALTGLAPAVVAQATPFGLREGMTKSDLEAVVGPLSAPNGTPPSYYAAHVPKPHPELDIYAVVVGDSTGLCQVVAGKLVDSTGATDIEAERIFSTLKGQLTSKYGTPSASEVAEARWLSISDAAIPANLYTITLNTARQSTGGILVSLRYQFTNVHRCEAPAPRPDPVRDAL